MEISLKYEAYSKENGRFLFEGEVSVRLSKAEAFAVCQDYFVWDYPSRHDDFETLYKRGRRKACREIYRERSLQRDKYVLEIWFSEQQSALFTDTFIQSFIKWVLQDAHVNGFSIYNDHGLRRFYDDALRVFSEYYSGDLFVDAKKIQDRILRL